MSGLAASVPVGPVVPDESGFVEREGVRIAWRSYGEGPAVLMIMGFMGSGNAWFRLLPHVAAGHRAIVFDNRGTGDSDRPQGLWTMDDLAKDAVAVLDAAGEETAHVVGASMGGMVAQHVALDHPERVRSLTLACTHAGGRRDAPRWRMVASVALRPVLGVGRSFPIVAPLLYAERSRREHGERVREDLEMRMRDATPVATALGQVAAIARHDTRRRLHEVDVPVLILHGEEDHLIPPSGGRELAELLPHAQLVMLPETGHVLTTDAEAATARALTRFLNAAGRPAKAA